MKLVKAFLQGISLAAACAVLSTTAHAQGEVKLAYLKTLSSIPFYSAQEMGYFKDGGIDLEPMLVHTGPAAASAAASGPAPLGYPPSASRRARPSPPASPSAAAASLTHPHTPHHPHPHPPP